MIEEQLVELALVLNSVLVVLLLAVWSAHGLWKTWRARITEPAVERARARLVQDLADGRIAAKTEAAVRSLSLNRQMLLLARVGRQISGRQRSLLAELARTTGLYQRAEADCGSMRWSRRLRGADVLTLLGGGEGAMTSLLRDPSVYVRTQAAEWAVGQPSPAVLEALLDLLDDPDSGARFAAADAVLRVGTPVVGAIAERLARTPSSGSARAGTTRLLDVAAGIRDTSFIPPALRLSRAEDPGVRARAVALLGLVGGEDAVTRAEELLDDPVARVRAAAVRALGNLGYWPAAPEVGGRLGDESWDVRREAGLALRAMGSPGQLVLRRATREGDPFAADMARLTLALPDTHGAEP
ncbi:MAG TPA: HEAT repeat domain-containing protein [Gemmatimonadota bacterium]|nr:HEAT repeat domain-containing protein [Gemmatimonadota bacterium]